MHVYKYTRSDDKYELNKNDSNYKPNPLAATSVATRIPEADLRNSET